MLKWLILLASAVALIDPFLLYSIYKHTGEWVFVVYFAPVVLGNLLAARMRNRANTGELDTFMAVADSFLSPAARALLWYPGPVTSFFGLLLLLPFTRRLAVKYALRRVMAGFTGQAGPGAMWSFGGRGGFPFGGAAGFSGGFGNAQDHADLGGGFRAAASPDNLKRTDARVVDDDPPQRPLLPE